MQPKAFRPNTMQPNLYFIIFPEKEHNKNRPNHQFSGPGRFWPRLANRAASLPGLQAQKPGPGPGMCRPSPASRRPVAAPTRVGRRIKP